MREKKYILKRIGDGKSAHLLVNADDEKDILKLCSCGRTENKDYTCDGSHKKDTENNGCCG
ncbi:hypothetical protein HY249_00320 [Candidatus Azambacteria bacterium]|nr:hypothetical protein [Candidatus Azambacteria bacterium]